MALGNAVLTMVIPPSPIFSLLPYCGPVMQDEAWALRIALIPGTTAKIMRRPTSSMAASSQRPRLDIHHAGAEAISAHLSAPLCPKEPGHTN